MFSGLISSMEQIDVTLGGKGPNTFSIPFPFLSADRSSLKTGCGQSARNSSSVLEKY